MYQFEKQKEQLLQQLEKDCTSFLKQNPQLSFYAMALDTNAEYAGILLCFNTEQAFQASLKQYQNGKYSQYYQTEEQIMDLRYNTGDWDYQGVASYTVFREEELLQMYKEDYQRAYEEMMDFNYRLLQAFCDSDIFQSIPKEKDFKVLCIDHEDDVLEALQKTQEKLTSKQTKNGVTHN